MENIYEGFHNFAVLLLPFGVDVSQQKHGKQSQENTWKSLEHMFQPSRFEQETPVLRGCLPSSRLISKSPVLRETCPNFNFFIKIPTCIAKLLRICSNSPVLSGSLPLWDDSSLPPISSWNLPFWDDPGMNVKYLWIFQVDHTFYKFDVKSLSPCNKIRCVRCFWPPSLSWAVDLYQQKQLLFWWTANKRQIS